MKRCTKCGLDKPLHEFQVRRKSIDGLQSACRRCKNRINRTYFPRFTDDQVSEKNRRAKARREKCIIQFYEYIKGKSCVDCGESDIICLQFDHRDSSQKRFNIGTAIGNRNWNLILAEISKCDLVCANCHCRRTAKQFKWRKAELQSAA